MKQEVIEKSVPISSPQKIVRKTELKRTLKPILYMLPALIIYITVIVIPTFYTFYLSLFEWNGVSVEKIFVGFGNYINLFTNDTVFLKGLKNNVIWTVLSLVFSMGFALLLALMLNKSFKGRALFRAVFYFPFILSNIVVAIIWVWIYHPNMGLLNELLNKVGIDSIPWLADPKIALYAVFIAATWQHVGSSMVIFLAGLQSMSKEPFEAAKVDGANSFQAFYNITLPLLRETFIIVFATTLFYSMRVFDIIYAMTGGGPSHSTQVLASWMYYQGFTLNNVGTGSAISMILLFLVMIIAVPYILWQGKKSHV
ncbi:MULTISPECIES: carbohydrate ABC transporter permease [Bacillaceae]|uniref:carbohydrate ABC transporter permease n=1 Tax=Bacillaceae TaxID=186817 RepID=UPI0004B58856|nr:MULTISPECIES: sugar ABC transporter permease [Bacillaceae]